MLKVLKDVKFNFINVLAMILVVLCFTFFFWISGQKPIENHNVGEIKTALINVVMLVIGYYFGSSRSSAKKDDTIQSMQENQTT